LRVVFCRAWLKDNQLRKLVLLAAFPLLMVKFPPELFIWAMAGVAADIPAMSASASRNRLLVRLVE
jgi:hypothetical protein